MHKLHIEQRVVYPGKNKQEDHVLHSSLAQRSADKKQQTISRPSKIRKYM